MQTSRHKITLGLSAGTADIWKRAALDLGFQIVNGPQQGDGNLTRLLSALAAGEVSTRKLSQALALAREAEANVGAAGDGAVRVQITLP